MSAVVSTAAADELMRARVDLTQVRMALSNAGMDVRFALERIDERLKRLQHTLDASAANLPEA